MIAVCPACHDACHHGTLIIDDETLYRWKGIERASEPEKLYSHVYVEPGGSPKILLGSIAIAREGENTVITFDLSSENKLSFSVKNGWLSVSSTFTDRDGKTILKITDNNIEVIKDKDIGIEQRPGKITITGPTSRYYLPAMALFLMQRKDPEYGANGTLIILDIEVLKPGLIKIQGIWPEGNSAIVVTDKEIIMCHTNPPVAIPWRGKGEDTVWMYTGPVTKALFR
jgi:hypothetical protein